jgi:hypothetical protein
MKIANILANIKELNKYFFDHERLHIDLQYFFVLNLYVF